VLINYTPVKRGYLRFDLVVADEFIGMIVCLLFLFSLPYLVCKSFKTYFHICLICCVLFLAQKLDAQKKADIGIQLGAASYMGDLNPSNPLKSPNLSFGVNYRYNFNPRYLIKASSSYVSLSASDPGYTTNNYYQGLSDNFTAKLIDIDVQFEFNFLPFTFAERKVGFTPYLSAGFGSALVLSGPKGGYYPTLPFAIGFKWNRKRQWSYGIEWNFRKLFSDSFDGISNHLQGKDSAPIVNNNDWYSYIGVFLAYKFFDTDNCPANQIRSSR
jgi:hypothetical protein